MMEPNISSHSIPHMTSHKSIFFRLLFSFSSLKKSRFYSDDMCDRQVLFRENLYFSLKSVENLLKKIKSIDKSNRRSLTLVKGLRRVSEEP